MNFISKVTESFSYVWRGEDCRRDLKSGMSDRELLKKYGEYTVSKVKKSLGK